ncbi:hypothetical protein F8388_017016 [Cannabis sativa]|uniref:Uncharacterized protein n=1 Tax=Cannabis sativa TaxID=3483 RepID=A0A7J6GCV7_CANSA|nr:hypothetical protein F8388_017016 [Cannabis sativa]
MLGSVIDATALYSDITCNAQQKTLTESIAIDSILDVVNLLENLRLKFLHFLAATMGVAERSEVYEREVISEQRVGAMVETNGVSALFHSFMEEEKFQKEPKMGLRIEVTLRSDPKPTYFGGFTRVLRELRIHLSLGLLFFGFKEDLKKGVSGVGIRNFQEVGPLDTSLNPRNSTWLQKSDLLFVVIETCYSFVEDTKLFVKNDLEVADDLTTMLKKLFNEDETLQKSPLFIVKIFNSHNQSLQLINKFMLGFQISIYVGVALGDSWISPADFVFLWGHFLKDVSRLDDNGFKQSQSFSGI